MLLYKINSINQYCKKMIISQDAAMNILSYLILSYLILSYLILSYLILSYADFNAMDTKSEGVATTRRITSRRIFFLLLIVVTASLVMYLHRYQEATASLCPIIMSQKTRLCPTINGLTSHKRTKPPNWSPKSQMCPDLKQIPTIKGLTSHKHLKAPNWLSSGYAVEIDEANNPTAIQNVQMYKSTIQACPQFFEAIIKDPKPVYQLCDTVELIITARDCNRTVLKSGGDFLWMWIKTDSLKASQTQEGNITDVGNGTYIARFTLRWVGEVKPVIAVVRTREEVEHLRNLRKAIPNRFAYNGYFKFNGSSEIVPCHTTPWMNLKFTKVKISKTRHLCNFSDPSTSSPWFCIKPLNMPCSAYDFTRGDTEREILYDDSKSFIQSSNKLQYLLNIKPSIIKVVPLQKHQSFSSCEFTKTLPICNSINTSASVNTKKATGFYYKNVWTSLQCQKSTYSKERIIKTLRNKYLLLFGDSTVRQWSEYLSDTLGNDTCTEQFSATRLVSSSLCNISVAFTFHGFPVRGKHYTATNADYIANRLDSLQIGGSDVIIVLTIWAHFTVNTLDFYRERLLSIRNAIYRLQTRHPGTRVFIKSANTREKALVSLSNWYAWECDQLMRVMLGNIPGITIIDVWSMTIGHYTGFHIHPKKAIIKNEVDMLLSYL